MINIGYLMPVGRTSQLCLLLVVVMGCSLPAEACERGLWWSRDAGACIPCTKCDPAERLAVKLPCQIHRDTICQHIHEIHLPISTPNEIKDRTSDSDYEYYEYANSDVGVIVEKKWDIQGLSLILAASGCLVFFVVLVSLWTYHVKQWKTLKLALKSDVQDLSAKLKLMEAGVTSPSATAADHHMYCNIHVTKDSMLGRISNAKGLGNVYTEEKPS